jgi:hypothetical protein
VKARRQLVLVDQPVGVRGDGNAPFFAGRVGQVKMRVEADGNWHFLIADVVDCGGPYHARRMHAIYCAHGAAGWGGS